MSLGVCREKVALLIKLCGEKVKGSKALRGQGQGVQNSAGQRLRTNLPRRVLDPSTSLVYNGFALVIGCTLKVVPFSLCFVQVMPLFRISFWLLRRSYKKVVCSGLQLFFRFSHI